MKRLFKQLMAWLDRRIEASERRKCRKRGHDWTEDGAIHPEPLIWMRCARMGCDARTEPVPARVTWRGSRCCTLTPVSQDEKWPEVIGG